MLKQEFGRIVTPIMREKNLCRFCEKSENLSLKSFGERRPFALTGAIPHYAPDRPFKLESILLDLEVQPKASTIEGWATQTVTAVIEGQQWIKLDQIGLQIKQVKVKDQAADFFIQGHVLNIQLPFTPKAGERFTFAVHYRVEKSRRGIFFTGPDEDHPGKPYQVWTQGQDEDSRYWFPTFDYPNQKAISEVIATVPKGFTAVSNGALLSKKAIGEKTQFHYRLGTPHVTYLISLVVAEFAEWSDQGPRGLPVQYFVAPGREADGKRAFGNTPAMIEAFEKKTGVAFPYEKYSQVAVQDFIFGGMENTSATTQTDVTLHDERAHLDFSSDPLVAHELAHQWFGDLLTCRDWSHGWLNEGFATFMERVWVECDPGPNGGKDEAKYYSYQDLKEYLNEDQTSYRRPIVCNTYIEPIDLFDTHLYQKGGLVLNLLRSVLGEDYFWKSIHLYLERHRGQNVETIDLIRAIEDTTGRNLRRFFDEWVFGAGYPEFELSYQWHQDKKMAECLIEQKQVGAAYAGISAQGGVFHLPVVLSLTLDNGEQITHRIDLAEARERIFLAAPSKPLMVRFDPEFNIPKTMKFPRPKEMLLYQLSHDSDSMGRIEAAQELAKVADLEVVRALQSALNKDKFWGVQAECAKALAEVRMDAARDALIASLGVTHPKARRAVALALVSFKDEVAASALKKVSQGDPSYFVEADALYGWALTQARSVTPSSSPASSGGAAKKWAEVKTQLLAKLSVPSYREVIRAAALKGLAELPGVERGEQPEHHEVLQTLMEWTQRGRPLDARLAAVRALGSILQRATASPKNQIMNLFSSLVDEDTFRLRVQLILAFAEAGIPEVIPLLAKIKQLDLDGRVTRAAHATLDRMALSGGVPESVAHLKGVLEKLEEDYRKLRSRVEEKLQ